MEKDKRFSVYVSRALDCLGKCQDMVKFRVDQYKQNESVGQVDIIIAGSKGEGLTAPFESDYDLMAVDNHVICADDISPFTHSTGYTVFETERRDTSPGYTKLRLDSFGGICDLEEIIQESLVNDPNGQLYCSSNYYMQNAEPLISVRDRDRERCGPSHRVFNKIANFSQYCVIAFRCLCPQITQSFITRPHKSGWPSIDQLAEISILESHVVPVGYSRSDKAFLEWRICYTKAERFLVRSLNDTQTKLYILLKMVAKTYINSISNEITSYVLKNIVLWLAECSDMEIFQEGLIVDRLIQALHFLRKCIINNNLPNYLIPDRNLFSEKLYLVQRQKLIFLLTELILTGGGLLMGCERLRGTMIVLYKEPVVAEQYRCQRDTIEKEFMCCLCKLANIDVNEQQLSIEIVFTKFRTFFSVILPLMFQGHDLLSIMS